MAQRYVSVCLNLKNSFLKSCVIALATFAYLTGRLVNIFLPQRHSRVVFYVLNSGLVGDPSLSKHCCDGIQQHLLLVAAFTSCQLDRAKQFDLNGFVHLTHDLRINNCREIFRGRMKHVQLFFNF